MIDANHLEHAIGARDWPRALVLALERWRDCRAVELAALIDDLDRELPRLTPPRKREELESWWRDHALAFDPIALPSLLASAAERPGGKGVWSEVRERWAALGFAAIATLERHTAVLTRPLEGAGWLERLIALVSWPDDPRVVPLLAAWFVTPPLTLNVWVVAGVMEVLADRLAELADPRVRPQLAACITEPRGIRDVTRDHQRRLAAQIVGAIDRRARPTPPALAAEIRRGAERMPVRDDPARAEARVTELWRGVIRDPDDAAARMVLADALVERGDPRGELIVLQCSGAAQRADQLLRRHFATWMGDAALVVSRKLCTFRDGMLEEARLGTARTPPWAWDKLANHRELATLRSVHAGHALAQPYAALVATLPNLRHVQLDAPEMLVHLASLGARLPVTTLHYFEYNPTLPADREVMPFADVCECLARCAPELETLDLGLLRASQAEIIDALPALPGRLPGLRRIRIANHVLSEASQQLASQLPMLELY